MISFACAQCGGSVHAEDRLIGQFTNCPACGNSVPVPLPDVTAEPVALPAEALVAEPVPAPAPSSPEPSPFAYMDGAGGPAVISSRVAERAYGYYGRDALGLAVGALLLTIFPCVNIVSPILALLSLVLSINGIIKCNGRSGTGMGFSIAGLVVSLLVGAFWSLAVLSTMLVSAR